MTADEIRDAYHENGSMDVTRDWLLSEIAAHLADINATLSRMLEGQK